DRLRSRSPARPGSYGGTRSKDRAVAGHRPTARGLPPAPGDRPRDPSGACVTRGGGQAPKRRLQRLHSSSPRLPITLFEEVAVLFDVRGKIERMLAHQPFRELGVAALECLDD